MGVEIRLPNITGTTEREQLLQLKSYLYQLSEQLQWAFDTIDTSGKSGAAYVVSEAPRVLASSGPSNSDAQATFASIKSLIIKSADIVDAYYEEINKRLEGVYVAQSDFGAYVEKTALEIEANSKNITQNYENIQVIIKDTKDELSGTIEGTVEEAKTELSGTIAGAKEELHSSITNTEKNAQAYAEAAKSEAQGYTDGAKSELDEKIGETANELDGKINETNGRIDETNGAVDGLGEGLAAANARIGAAEGALEQAKTDLSGQIKTVSDSLSTTDELLASAQAQLQGSVDDLAASFDGLNKAVLDVTAYVKSGQIYETDAGIPVYGIEIGQDVEINGATEFKKFARFTSEKLSFYDANSVEVAYISDKKLYIGQAEITIGLKVGGLVDLVMANGDVVTKWEGVSG